MISSQLVPLLGDVRLADLTPERIDAACRHLRRARRRQRAAADCGEGEAAHSVLHSALAQAMRWWRLWDNPADHARRVVVTRTERRPPDEAELAQLLEHVAADDAQFHTLLVPAATTGARRAQLLALRWADADLDGAKIAFRAGLVEGERGPEFTARSDYTTSATSWPPRCSTSTSTSPSGRPAAWSGGAERRVGGTTR
ncbi:MAG: hypothetical protein OEY23_16800 [Acidimicrobiia bacterium]|nr:hypothetical protein [Acidimicrobiia bacterium]